MDKCGEQCGGQVFSFPAMPWPQSPGNLRPCTCCSTIMHLLWDPVTCCGSQSAAGLPSPWQPPVRPPGCQTIKSRHVTSRHVTSRHVTQLCRQSQCHLAIPSVYRQGFPVFNYAKYSGRGDESSHPGQVQPCRMSPLADAVTPPGRIQD